MKLKKKADQSVVLGKGGHLSGPFNGAIQVADAPLALTKDGSQYHRIQLSATAAWYVKYVKKGNDIEKFIVLNRKTREQFEYDCMVSYNSAYTESSDKFDSL